MNKLLFGPEYGTISGGRKKGQPDGLSPGAFPESLFQGFFCFFNDFRGEELGRRRYFFE